MLEGNVECCMHVNQMPSFPISDPQFSSQLPTIWFSVANFSSVTFNAHSPTSTRYIQERGQMYCYKNEYSGREN